MEGKTLVLVHSSSWIVQMIKVGMLHDDRSTSFRDERKLSKNDQ